MVTTVAGSAPMIDDLHAATRTSAQVRAGETLVLEGSGLLGEATEVTIDGLTGIAQVTSAREDRVAVLIADDPRLTPGIHALRLSHGALIGEPLRRRATFVSNTRRVRARPAGRHRRADRRRRTGRSRSTATGCVSTTPRLTSSA